MTKENKIVVCRILIAAGLFVLSVIFGAYAFASLLLSVTAYVTVGYDVFITAVKKLMRGRALDESFLMCIASVGAMIIGELHEGIFVMLFYKVGELFERIAVERSRRSITALLEKMPSCVVVLRDGVECMLKPEEVLVGETVVLKPGDKAPLDGRITDGFALMDTSAITGESAPRSFGPGDEIVSGYINLNGSIKLCAEKEFYDSTVYKIMEMVESATMQKSKAEHFITKFAKVYTPIVVAFAALLALVPPLFSNFADFSVWLHRAFVFLVVSCPCALVISVPLSFFGGIGNASRKGILIKGSNYIELLSRVHTVAFDKTGTLTDGDFAVARVETNGFARELLLKLVAAVESHSTHKLAAPICAAAEYGCVQVERFEECAGLGVRAVADGREILCGCYRWMVDSGVKGLCAETSETSVYVAMDGAYAGRIILEDKPRENASAVFEALHKSGVKQICVLTGDHASNAQKLKTLLPIDALETGLLPADKVKCIERYLPAGVTCFVGDGINDAPVLGRADVGFAMGAMGSDVAIEAADVVLLNDDLAGVAEAVRISKKTVRIVKQNIIFAISVKLLVLALGAFGLAGMWEAVFADVGVSVIAILNAMRLLWSR